VAETHAVDTGIGQDEGIVLTFGQFAEAGLEVTACFALFG
jgi:hypothetical protein